MADGISLGIHLRLGSDWVSLYLCVTIISGLTLVNKYLDRHTAVPCSAKPKDSNHLLVTAFFPRRYKRLKVHKKCFLKKEQLIRILLLIETNHSSPLLFISVKLLKGGLLNNLQIQTQITAFWWLTLATNEQELLRMTLFFLIFPYFLFWKCLYISLNW